MASLVSLDELLGRDGSTETKENSLVSLDELLSPNTGYDSWGDSLTKVAKRAPQIAKGQAAGVLQGIAEQPIAALLDLVNTPPEREYTGLRDYAKNYVTDSAKTGLNSLRLAGSIGPKLLADYLTGGDAAEYAREARKSAQEKLNSPEYAHNNEGGQLSPKNLTIAGLESLVQLVPGLGASILTKNPSFALGSGMLQSGGEAYGEQRDAGRSIDQATMAALGTGAAEALGDYIPLLNLLEASGPFLKRIGKQMALEGITEAPTQLVQDLIKKETIHPDMSDEEIRNNFIAAGIIGAGIGGVTGTAKAGYDKVIDGVSKKQIEQASALEEKLSQINDTITPAKESASLVTLEELMGITNKERENANEIISEVKDEGRVLTDEANLVEAVDQSQVGQNNDTENSGSVRERLPEDQGLPKESKDRVYESQEGPEQTSEQVKKQKPIEELGKSAEKKLAYDMTSDEYIESRKPDMLNEVSQTFEEFVTDKGEKIPSREMQKRYEQIITDGILTDSDKQFIDRNGQDYFDKYNGLVREYKENISSGNIKQDITHNQEMRLLREHKALVSDAIARGEHVSENVLSEYKDLSALKKLEQSPIQKLEQAKIDVIDHIKQIHPSVEVKLVDKLFSNNPDAVIASGAPNGRRREVAGSYNKLNNLITISTNQKPSQITSTALHEAYHSVEPFLTADEKALLAKTYPSRGKKTSSEIQAEAFAKSYKNKGAPRGVFGKVRGLVKDIGKILGANDIDQSVFDSIKDGSVGKRAVSGKALSSAMKDNSYTGVAEAWRLDMITPKSVSETLNDLASPTLTKIVKEKMTANEATELLDVIAETTGNSDDIAYALKAKSILGLETIENVNKKLVDIASPFMTEQKAASLMGEIEETFKTFTVEGKDTTVGEKLKHYFDLIYHTNDGYLGALAARTDSNAVSKIKDMFFADRGSGKTTGKTYYEEQNIFVGETLSQLGKISEGMTDSDFKLMTKVMQGEAKAPAGSLVAQREHLFRKLMENINDHSRSSGMQFGEIENYVRRIYDNTAILSDRSGFIKAASEAYLTTYKENLSSMKADIVNRNKVSVDESKQASSLLKLRSKRKANRELKERIATLESLEKLKRKEKLELVSAKENLKPDEYYTNKIRKAIDKRKMDKTARERFAEETYNLRKEYKRLMESDLASDAHTEATAWYDRIFNEETGVNTSGTDFNILAGGGAPTPNAFKERTLSKAADEIMRPYLFQDIRDLMSSNIQSISNKVAFDRRFGGDKASLLQDKLIDLGVGQKEAASIAKSVRDSKLDHKGASDALTDFLNNQGLDGKQISDAMTKIWNTKTGKSATIDTRWKLLKHEMQKEGLLPEQIQEVVNVIKQNTNMRRREVNKNMRDLVDAAKAYSYFAHLPRAALSQAGEFAVSTIQTGNPLRLFSSFYSRVKALGNIIRKGAGFSGAERQEMLSDAAALNGIASDYANNLLLQSRLNLGSDNKKLRLMTERFFAKTGQTALAKADKLAAVDTGMLYMNRLAERILSDSRLKKSSEYFLRDMGVPQDKMESFAKHVKEVQKQMDSGNLEIFYNKGEMGELYTLALNRFVDSSIIQSTPAMRQRIGNDPILGVMYSFLSYTMGFTKQVLQKSYKQFKAGLKGGGGLTVADRLYLSSSFGMLPVMFLMGGMIKELQNAFAPSPESEERLKGQSLFDPTSDKFQEALSMSGLTGGYDYIANIMRSYKYSNSFIEPILGASVGDAHKFLKANYNYFVNNSANTNTAERNLAKQYYNLVAVPLINAYVPTFVPGFTLPFITTQAASAPATKSAVVDMLAGSKMTKSEIARNIRKNKAKQDPQEKRQERIKKQKEKKN